MNITDYKNSDRSSLISLYTDFKQETAAVSNIFDALNADFQAAICGYLDKQIANPDGTILIAIDGAAVGFIIAEVVEYFPFCQVERIGHIKELFVAEGYRGRGIGKQLIKALEQLYVAQGIGHFRIETIVYYEKNRAIYESMGYQPFLLDLRKSVK